MAKTAGFTLTEALDIAEKIKQYPAAWDAARLAAFDAHMTPEMEAAAVAELDTLAEAERAKRDARNQRLAEKRKTKEVKAGSTGGDIAGAQHRPGGDRDKVVKPGK